MFLSPYGLRVFMYCDESEDLQRRQYIRFPENVSALDDLQDSKNSLYQLAGSSVVKLGFIKVEL